MMSGKTVLALLAILSGTANLLHTQDSPQITLRPRASEEIILAVADVQPATVDQPPGISDALVTFNEVLRDDLSFSGFFTIAARRFYPPGPIVRLDTDIDFDEWSALPFPVSFLTVGTLNLTDGVLRAELSIVDMKQRKPIPGKRFIGNTDQIRTIAHRWADEVVYKLTAGASRGIASTKIAYVSQKGKAKEIYVADYDGHNPHAFTHNDSINLFPNWAPDNSKLTFVSYRTGKPEINIYSYIDGSRVPFPMFNTLASTPAISPDGKKIVYSLRTPRGDTDLFVSNLDGSGRRNITNNPAIDNAPTWSPSGRQIAFESDRYGKTNQIYICDADGTNIRRIIKERGDAGAPVWSPDGRYLVFQWKPRKSTRYDLFIVESAGGQIYQLTSNSGSNESPSWAPDGRHLAFQSNRSGSEQIYIMRLNDSSEPRRITNIGRNTTPAWGGYLRGESVN
jgi:TolB protein